MKIDFGDVFASGIGWLVKQLLLFLLAIWTGCTTAAVALSIGSFACGQGVDFGLILVSPLLLLSLWLIPNLCFLAAAIYWFIRNETSSYTAWAVLATVETFICLAGWAKDLDDGLGIGVAWGSSLVLLGMMGTGLWFIRQWHLNRWAGEMAMLKSENAMRRSELKDLHGTESVGQDEWERD